MSGFHKSGHILCIAEYCMLIIINFKENNIFEYCLYLCLLTGGNQFNDLIQYVQTPYTNELFLIPLELLKLYTVIYQLIAMAFMVATLR